MSLTYALLVVPRGTPKVIKKSLEYAIIATFIDFNPDKYALTKAEEEKLRPRLVIVDGAIAIKLKGRVYTKV